MNSLFILRMQSLGLLTDAIDLGACVLLEAISGVFIKILLIVVN